MSYLIHYNDKRWPAGAPGGVGGQFAPKFGRARYVERGNYQTYVRYDPETGREYQGPGFGGRMQTDERLTEAGRRRYQAEQAKNNAKAKKNRMEEEAVGDVDRWVEDDLKNYQNIATGVKDISRQTSDIAGKVFKDPPRGRYDLSEMSDAELASILRREQMERQYNDYFNPPQVNKGREYVQDVANAAGVIGGLAATGLGIALSIKQLRS